MQPFRIFLSSPGDVGIERDRSELVVRRINSERRDRRPLQLIRWEDDYYLATKGSFQDQIVKPSECDLVVCIFWKRLGSELPDHYARPDGTIPTGTEYEFEDALKAAENADPRLPGVLVYKKTADITFSLETLEQERMQYDRFMTFWSRWFRNEKGHFLAGFQSFADADAFEAMFERNMRGWLRDQETAIEWKNGSPYRGLEAFGVEHAPVFFGRRRETERARARLIQAAMGDTAFLLVTGASGAGKSSLARAGLIPLLAQPGGLGALSSAMRYAILTPGEIAGNWAEGLAAALFADHAIAPELEQGDFDDAAALGAQLHRADAAAISPVLSALRRAAVNLAKKQARAEAADVTLVLLVDQLEELFAWPKAEAEGFLRVLRLLATAKGHPVWVVATMRSDFQHRLAEYADLDLMAGRSEIRGPGEGERTLELVLPRPGDLRSIILKPAAAAGLSFESAGGRDLAHLIEVEARPELMPAIQLLMSELYERRQGTVLTLAAHDALGGVSGVMAHRGDEVFAGASDAAKAAFPRIVRALVTQVRDDAPASARRVPEAAFDGDDGARALVGALRQARLITSHQGELRFAHESILAGWQRLGSQIAGERRLYEARQRIEETYRRWKTTPESDSRTRDGLLLTGLNLAEGRELLGQWGEAALKDREPGLPAFLAASDARDKRAGRVRMALVSGVAVALALFGGVATKFWLDADAARVAADKARIVADDARQSALAAQKKTEVALADAVEAKKNTIVALKVAESGMHLTDGDVGAAAGKAVQAYEAQPASAPRSAVVQAGLEISPYLQHRWQFDQPVIAFDWLDADRVVMADTRNTLRVVDVTPGKKSHAARSYAIPRTLRPDGEAATVLALKALTSDTLLAVMNEGSVYALAPDGSVSAPYQPAERDVSVESLQIVETGATTFTLLVSLNREFMTRDCVLAPDAATIACQDRKVENVGSVEAVAADRRAETLVLAMNPVAKDEHVLIIDREGKRRTEPLKFNSGISNVAMADDGDFLAFADVERMLTLTSRKRWDAEHRHSHALVDVDLVAPRLAWRPGTRDIYFTCYINAVCSRLGLAGKTGEVAFFQGPRFDGHRSAITTMVWDRTGKRLLTRDTLDEVRIWSFDQSTAFSEVMIPAEQDFGWTVSAMSGDGKNAAFAMSQTEGDVSIVPMRSGQGQRHNRDVIPTPSDVRSLAFTPGRVYAGTVTGLVSARLGDRQPDRSFQPSDDEFRLIRALAATGRRDEVVALVGDGRVGLFDAGSRAPLEPRFLANPPTDEAPYGLIADPTRRQALVSYRDGSVQAFSLETLKHVDTLKNTHAEDIIGVDSLSVSPDGRLLASSGKGNYVLLYDLETRATRGKLTAQKGDVIWVAFSPSGHRLAALDTDGKVTIWDMTGPEPVQNMAFRTMPLTQQQQAAGRQNAHVNALHWTDDGHLLFVGGVAPVRLVSLDEAAWLQRITDLGYRLDKLAD